MTRHVLGVFSDDAVAHQAVNALIEGGLDRKNVSLLRWEDPKHGEEILEYDQDERAEAINTGLWGGGTLGAIAGLLVGAAEILIAGPIGVVAVLGPLAAALGGATVGAAVGGFVGSLTNLGMSERDADFLMGRLRNGASVVAVETAASHTHDVEEQIKTLGVEDVLTI